MLQAITDILQSISIILLSVASIMNAKAIMAHIKDKRHMDR